MSAITKSAKGEECQIRIPTVCNGNTETTVFCHLGGGGMGMKQRSAFGAYGCSNCHDVVDFRLDSDHSYKDIKIWFYDAVIRTQKILFDKGLLLEK